MSPCLSFPTCWGCCAARRCQLFVHCRVGPVVAGMTGPPRDPQLSPYPSHAHPHSLVHAGGGRDPPVVDEGQRSHFPLTPGCPGETEAQWGSSAPSLSQSLPAGWHRVAQAHPGEGDSRVPSATPAPRFAGSPWYGGSWGCSPIPRRLLSSVIENQPALTNLTRADTRMLWDLRSL